MCRCIAGIVYVLEVIIYIHRIGKCKCAPVNMKLHTCIPMGNPDIDYLDLYNTAMGRLKHSRSSCVGTSCSFLPPQKEGKHLTFENQELHPLLWGPFIRAG